MVDTVLDTRVVPSRAKLRSRSRAIVWLLGGLGAWSGCAHDEATPRAPVIRQMELVGVRQLSQRDIKKRIATSATGWWWPFAKKQYFDPVTWQSDLRRIERVYEARGFYQAEVVSDEVRPEKRGVALKATISEGKPTLIASFDVRRDIRGLEALTPAERDVVLDDLGLAEGEIFREDRWASAKDKLRARLRGLGFAEVDVNGSAQVDVNTQKAALVIVARTGQRFRFGDIQLDLGADSGAAPGGVPGIDPAWVWEQVRLAIRADESFSDEALDEAQKRVFAMGLFATAKVTAGTPDRTSARIPILVEARVAPLRTLRMGAGARVDQVRNEARLLLEWSHRNFHGGMRKLTARAEAGWAFIPNTYAVLRDDIAAGPRHGPIARLGLAFEQPRFVGRPSLRERTTLDLERTLEQSYDAIGGRLATGVAWQPRSTLSVYPTYNIQTAWLNGPAIAGASAAPLTLGCASQANECFIVLSYLEQVIAWDRRDSPLEARRGFFAGLSLQEGGGPLGGGFTYLGVSPDLRGYVSVGDDHQFTFSTRLRVGELFPVGGQTAVTTRFFGGGGVSMRGFSNRRLSPLLLAPAPASPGATPVMLTLPIGGDGMIDGSFEVKYQLTEHLVVAAFVDYGQVTQGHLGPGDVATLLWAVGAGVRYRTPIGPIRVDFARRLQRGRPPVLLGIDAATGAVAEVPYLVNDSCFGLGGSGRSTVVTDSLCALHIGIGEAF